MRGLKERFQRESQVEKVAVLAEKFQRAAEEEKVSTSEEAKEVVKEPASTGASGSGSSGSGLPGTSSSSRSERTEVTPKAKSQAPWPKVFGRPTFTPTVLLKRARRN